MMSETKKVYSAINGVQLAISKIGIAKDQKNHQGAGYMFRGIDSIYNALAPLLAENKLCVLPRMISRECVERSSKSGGALFYVVVEAEFDFVSAEDGSMHTIRTFGEAMDSSDKATNKAMSAAYKYAAFQTFCIPTEGDNDADASTPVPVPVVLRPCPDNTFTEGMPKLVELLKKGKTTYELIEMLSSKYALTDVQEEAILKLEANG
jgi:hypothetical protein